MAQGSHPPFPDTTVGGGSGCLDQNLFGGWLPAHLEVRPAAVLCLGKILASGQELGQFPFKLPSPGHSV